MQHRALRKVYKGKFYTEELRVKAGIDILETRRNKHLLGLMYNRAQHPMYTDIGISDTRAADGNLLSVPYPRTKKLQRAPIYQGSQLWTKLCQNNE